MNWIEIDTDNGLVNIAIEDILYLDHNVLIADFDKFQSVGWVLYKNVKLLILSKDKILYKTNLHLLKPYETTLHFFMKYFFPSRFSRLLYLDFTVKSRNIILEKEHMKASVECYQMIMDNTIFSLLLGFHKKKNEFNEFYVQWSFDMQKYNEFIENAIKTNRIF